MPKTTQLQNLLKSAQFLMRLTETESRGAWSEDLNGYVSTSTFNKLLNERKKEELKPAKSKKTSSKSSKKLIGKKSIIKSQAERIEELEKVILELKSKNTSSE